jgi:hypothetical protein
MKSILKKSWLAILTLTLLSIQQLTAQTLKEFFNSSEVPLTYLGIDFTQARLYNDAGANVMDIRSRLYAQINQLTVNEKKKYDVSEAFSKSNVTNDISLTLEKNTKIDAEKIIDSKQPADRLKKADIETIVKGYSFEGKKGIGLLIVMENMDKAASQASMFYTLIDMSTKKVLFTERLSGEAGGIGFRNLWARPIANTLIAIKKSKYKEWKGTVK